MIGFVERRACPCCQSPDFSMLRSVPFRDPRVFGFLERYYADAFVPDDFGSTPYEVAECTECGALWQRFILDERGMENLYEHWIDQEESFAKKHDGNRDLFVRYAEEVGAIGRFCGERPDLADVLDFGMGWGYWCRMAAAFNYNVCGYELSARRCEYAARFGIEVIGSMQALRRKRFDFINCEQVLEHLPEPLETLTSLRALLKPGGVIRISVPDATSMPEWLAQEKWSAHKDALHPLEHVNAFTHASLKRTASLAGLTWLDDTLGLAGSHATALYFIREDSDG